MNLKGCFSKNSDNWRTPSDRYQEYMKDGFIDCFPYMADYDEFENVYFHKKLFVNPPYSKLKLIPKWLKKQVDNGCLVHLLIPARTDTKYFHELLEMFPEVIFIKGRLHFNDSKAGAPFPSLILVFRSSYGLH